MYLAGTANTETEKVSWSAVLANAWESPISSLDNVILFCRASISADQDGTCPSVEISPMSYSPQIQTYLWHSCGGVTRTLSIILRLIRTMSTGIKQDLCFIYTCISIVTGSVNNYHGSCPNNHLWANDDSIESKLAAFMRSKLQVLH